jgi:hypothetical protein
MTATAHRLKRDAMLVPLAGAAYHEAGHAVVALALGLKVARVEIFPDDYSGATDAHDANRLPIEDQIAICLGGINAVNMFGARLHELANFQDHVRVWDLVSDLDEAEGDGLRDRGHQRAWHLLKAHASDLKDIAALLLADHKIDLTGYVLKR